MRTEQSEKIELRQVEEQDLEIFFEHQTDPEANMMAAFTAKNPHDKEAFTRHWKHILADEQIWIRTIIQAGQVAGYVLSYLQSGEREVSYWLGREYWGKGIAAAALAEYLQLFPQRPMSARAAQDNKASLRVLEKCGFRIIGQGRGFANGRGEEVDEYLLWLDQPQETGGKNCSV